jgi:protein-L-isoaspartate(D-aspartate) O-methyltransferase
MCPDGGIHCDRRCPKRVKAFRGDRGPTRHALVASDLPRRYCGGRHIGFAMDRTSTTRGVCRVKRGDLPVLALGLYNKLWPQNRTRGSPHPAPRRNRSDRRRLVAAVVLLPLAARAFAQEPFAGERERMLNEIDSMMRLTGDETGRAHLSPRIRQAIASVPRHRFVSAAQQAYAYADRPLPIGAAQTISQPFIVALMTELLDTQPSDRVLEVGTGSGYQAAVLAECVARVFTVEIVRSLGERAAALLSELGYRNIEVRVADGYLGWPEAAPFDRIIVTAAPDHVPQPLIDQLRPGGRMVIPVGAQSQEQELLLITKGADGSAVAERKISVRFVPLTREQKP